MTEFVAALMQMMEAAAAGQASAGQMPAERGGLAQMRAMAAAPYMVQARGTETVGGRTGTRYIIAPEQAGARARRSKWSSPATRIWRRLARELRGLIGLVVQPAAAILGQAPDLLTELDGLLARGVPIRIGQHFRLDSVSAAPVAAASFVLPAPVMTPGTAACAIAAGGAAGGRRPPRPRQNGPEAQ